MRGMNDLVRQAQVMHKKIEKMQKELETQTVEATSGGGMVTVTANGGGEVVGIRSTRLLWTPMMWICFRTWFWLLLPIS